jgi:hypothetical protein
MLGRREREGVAGEYDRNTQTEVHTRVFVRLWAIWHARKKAIHE